MIPSLTLSTAARENASCVLPGEDYRIMMPTSHDTLRPLTDREFRQFRGMIFQEAGINLIDAKKALVAGRLPRRVHEPELRDYNAYFQLVEPHPPQPTRMNSALCPHPTP